MTDSETLPSDAVQVGRIAGAFGVRGEFRVKTIAAHPEAVFSSKRWFLRESPSNGPLRTKPVAPPANNATARRAASAPGLLSPFSLPSVLKIVRAREQGEWVVASAQGIDDRDAAQALAGAQVWVSRASFPTPDEGDFYWVDLIGLTVVNRQGETLGDVVGLIETGPSSVLRVQPPTPRQATGATMPDAAAAPDEILIPFAAAYVDEVDLPAKQVRVDWQSDY